MFVVHCNFFPFLFVRSFREDDDDDVFFFPFFFVFLLKILSFPQLQKVYSRLKKQTS